MKRMLALGLVAIPAATPALAHGGAHLHPHGAETVILALALIAALGMLTWFLARR